jgi:hypothetical protein
VREKLLLIDAAWHAEREKDERLAYAVDFRVDDVEPEHVPAAPSEQFVRGFYCERCSVGFLTDDQVKRSHRRYFSQK